jgi:hypothetical protein
MVLGDGSSGRPGPGEGSPDVHKACMLTGDFKPALGFFWIVWVRPGTAANSGLAHFRQLTQPDSENSSRAGREFTYDQCLM